MNELLLILMGAILTSIPWIILYGRSAIRAHQEMIVEKERSFQAGFKHAKSLICFRPVAPNVKVRDRSGSGTPPQDQPPKLP